MPTPPSSIRSRESPGRRSTGRGHHADALVATFTARASDLAGGLATAQRTTDRNLRLQYLAGFALNTTNAGEIYSEIFGAGPAFPAGAVTGTPAQLEELRQRLAGRSGDC